MELVKGRPTDCSGRLEREVRVYDLLDKLELNTNAPTTRKQTRWKSATRLTKFSTQSFAKIFFSATDNKQSFIF